MSAGHRLIDSLVRIAAGRWPTDIRDSMREEWRAELAVIRDDRGIGALRRFGREMSFASSLACSPPVEPDGAVAIGWRRALPAWGRAAQRLALMVGVAVLASVFGRLNVIAAIVGAGGGQWHQIGRFATELLAIVGMVALGAALARRIGRLDPGAGPWRSASFVVLPMSVGALIVFVATEPPTAEPGALLTPRDALASVAAWTAVMVVAVAVATRARQAGRRWLAWTVAAIGSLVAVDLAGFAAATGVAIDVRMPLIDGPAWFPMSYLPPDALRFGTVIPAGTNVTIGNLTASSSSATHASSFVIDAAVEWAPPLLLCCAFVVAYGLRETHAVVVPVPAGAPGRFSMLTAVPTRAVAAIASTIGLAVWAAVSAWQRSPGLDAFQSGQIQLRLAAVVLVAAGLGILVAGRGPVTIAVSAALVLLGADVVVERQHWSGAGVAAILFLFGALAAGGAWVLAGHVAGPGTTPTTARRSLLTVGAVAALAVPTGASVADIFADRSIITLQPGVYELPTTPPVPLTLATLAIAALLLTVAFVAVLASRSAPLPTVATLTFALIAVGVFAVGIVDPQAVAHALYWPTPRFFVQPVLVVVVLAAAWWRPGAAPVRAPVLWSVAGIGAAVASVPLSDLMQSVVNVTSAWLVTAERLPAYGFDLYPAGAAVVGLVLGVMAARRIVPSEDRLNDSPPARERVAGGGAMGMVAET